MDPIPTYDLLQAIDPTKIKVPISERFAKLTLSSNKKQQEKFNDPEQQEELKKQQEKRVSVTRNICKQFDEENVANKPELDKNPLLRSQSSKESQLNNSEDAVDLTMEPLAVSDEDDDDGPTKLDDDIGLLSQQIASMSIVVDQPKAISLSSSGSTDNISVFTDLLLSESQRSSTSDVDKIHIIHNIPVNVKEAVKQQTIPISNFDKTYEMTDDDDDEKEEDNESEDKAITISDTSTSNCECEQNKMDMSSLPSRSVASEDLRLPSLIDDKSERVAAFLRDVSAENRAMEEHGQDVFHDTIDQILDNNEIDKIQKTPAKSRNIATADTESMTPDESEEATPKTLTARAHRLKDLNECTEKEHTETDDTPKGRNLDHIMAKNIQRLANDETVDNTVMTETDWEYEIEKSLNILSKLKSPYKCNPKNIGICKNDVNKIANKETQCNTDYPTSEKTPKSATKNKTQNTPNSRRLVDLETEDNTENLLTPKKHRDPCRLVNEDTVANSLLPDFEEALPHQSRVYSNSQNYRTPGRASGNRSPLSIHSTPSIGSIINSSNEINAISAENSITISETDDENVHPETPEKSIDMKLSNSFHRESSSDDSDSDGHMSQILMSMGSINISAKINIKVHIPIITYTDSSSADDKNDESDNQDNKGANQQPDVSTENSEPEEELDNDCRPESKEKSIESGSPQAIANNVQEDRSADSKEQSVESDSPQGHCNQMHLKTPLEKISSPPKIPPDSEETVEDEKFLTEAEKLLNQLYGNAWQTPDIIRTLKRSNQSGDKKSASSKSSASKTVDIKNSSSGKKSSNKKTVEETMLDDFSIFRRNIVKTNLDSTRLATTRNLTMQNRGVSTEPRNKRKLAIDKEKINSKPVPETERKQALRNTVRRVNAARWRDLLDDSDCDGDNASDDDDADKSWNGKDSEAEVDDSDPDFKISPITKGRKRNTNTRQGRSDKSDYLMKTLDKSKEGEIVYLDLTKEEVEVQNDMAESPPANHDLKFATRLEDILKSCRHEDKTKLPSSNKKTKRKLFTPNFGDDDHEVFSSKKDEANTKENIEKTNKIKNILDEILEDSGNMPFDSQGRPKRFNLINKHLESVKTGKPIFPLTPPSKKKGVSSSTNKICNRNFNVKNDCGDTPKAKLDDDAIFKTPLSVRSKGPPEDFKELSNTPDYKYSFLKSLDVTVSKTLCHPDALYYRDNYRTKKEELAKILYDMYNEKLFDTKLNVPLKWNKKLLNTAGRCFNKKKSGIRCSSIELSDKVLTSADRLRCTLIHELCHAATWIYNGEGGHGSSWKEWARRANDTFPEIPKIGVCHQYDIEYKYTYKCMLCGAKSHAHSKSKKVENIRCSYCHGAIEIFLNKKDKHGNVIPTPVKEPAGFAKFVQDNYKKYKRDYRKHADVMKILSSEFAALKVVTT